MCMFSSPSMPAAPPPPAPPAPPKDVDPAISAAKEDERRRAALARGRSSTILTGGRGLTSEPRTAGKSLLGQ